MQYIVPGMICDVPHVIYVWMKLFCRPPPKHLFGQFDRLVYAPAIRALVICAYIPHSASFGLVIRDACGERVPMCTDDLVRFDDGADYAL
jgi:hypothetical protein